MVGDGVPGGQDSSAVHAGCAARHLDPLQHQREDQAGVGRGEPVLSNRAMSGCLADRTGAVFTSLRFSCGSEGGSADSEVGSAWDQGQWQCFFP